MLSANIIFVVLSLNLAFVVGTNQHLFCKTVDDVFTDGPANTLNIRRVLHGSPGKRGQKGVKGELGLPGSKGEKGLPGLVDPQNVDNVIEEKMEEANRELLSRIETLERLVTNMSTSIADITDRLSCSEDLFYKDKCYYAIIHKNRNVPHEEIDNLCGERGGKPADILNREHQNFIVEHIKTNRTSNFFIFLGMSYLPSTATLVWSTGEKMPSDIAGEMLWYSGYPRPDSNYNQMHLGSDSSLGIYNSRSDFNQHGVLCEKKTK